MSDKFLKATSNKDLIKLFDSSPVKTVGKVNVHKSTMNTTKMKTENYKQFKSILESEKEEKKRKLLQENSRINKWNQMLSDFSNFRKKNYEKLKSRVRKGIPDCIRGLIWQIIADVDKYREDEQLKDKYLELINDENLDIETESTILRDLDRTFPRHSLFKDKYGMGQKNLFNVLRAYAKYEPSVKYVQGMGFIVGLLLTYMDEESSFWMIHAIIDKYEMRGNYVDNFPGLQKLFFKFLHIFQGHMPKLYNLFKENGIHPTFYAVSWFMTLFANELSFDIVARIFDSFFMDGEETLYRVALSLLKMNEEKFFKCSDSANISILFGKLSENVEADNLFETAFKFIICKEGIQVNNNFT